MPPKAKELTVAESRQLAHVLPARARIAVYLYSSASPRAYAPIALRRVRALL